MDQLQTMAGKTLSGIRGTHQCGVSPADDAAAGLAVAGLNLQGAGYRLPHVHTALPDVQHGDVHEGHLDGAVRPQLDVVHGTLV